MAFFSKRYHPPGTPPGTLTEKSTAQVLPCTVEVFDYSADHLEIIDDPELAACAAHARQESVTWIHVQGHPTERLLQGLADNFKLHPLALEDVLNSGQRPKIEAFADQLFIAMSRPGMVANVVEVEQVSIFVGAGYVITLSAGETHPFQPIIARLRDAGSRLRRKGVDYLLYSLLDVVIDEGFPVLEAFGIQMEELEEEILRDSDARTLERIHVVKRELILLRRLLWPQREVINALLRDDHELIGEGTSVYLRDCYDHTIQVMDLLETYRDMASSMLDIYLSSVSNRMNEIMRVLTVIATIFIPLTFIVGVYGMNFDRSASRWNMPELGAPYGYPLTWLGMILIVVVMLVLFRRNRWF